MNKLIVDKKLSKNVKNFPGINFVKTPRMIFVVDPFDSVELVLTIVLFVIAVVVVVKKITVVLVVELL